MPPEIDLELVGCIRGGRHLSRSILDATQNSVICQCTPAHNGRTIVIRSKGGLVKPIALATICTFVSVATFAQSDRGSMTGAVSDQVNAVIPGAHVVARNTQT